MAGSARVAILVPVRRVGLLLLLVFSLKAQGQSLFGGVGPSGGGSGLLSGAVGAGLTALLDHEAVLNTDEVDHPRDVEPRLFLGLGAHVQGAKVLERSGDGKVNAFPWTGLYFEAGSSFTYRDRVMLSVSGAWGFSGYMLRTDTVFNSVYHSTKRAEARLAWHTHPRWNKPMQWSFGSGFGFNFQRVDERTIQRDGFTAFTVAPEQVRAYVAPEIGRFSAVGRDRMELTLRYVHHLDRTLAWTNSAAAGATTARFGATDDYVGLLLRYHIGTKHKVPAPPPATLQGVALDTVPQLTSKRQRITLVLWDDAEVDGDTVSVFLNERPVLVRHCLTHDPVKLRLDLGHNSNFISVVAHNEGRIPPNTARGYLRRGKGREQLLIKSSRSHGQLFVVVRR